MFFKNYLAFFQVSNYNQWFFFSVGKIVKNHPSRHFDGYVDKDATERKIVRGNSKFQSELNVKEI